MLHDLNMQYAIPGLTFAQNTKGFTRAVVKTPTASGELYLQGAHVTSWFPFGHKPVLWLSQCSNFEKGKPIRGGVPICVPWFGPNAKVPSAPAHGFARLVEWRMASAESKEDGAIALRLEASIEPFSVSFNVEFGPQLKMTLRTRLSSNATSSVTFEDALHTYFSVSDVRSIAIGGLEKTSYVDKADQAALKPATNGPIRITSETDRVYLNTIADCVLTDEGLGRTIRVAKTGSASTVIWNPWIDKSIRMTDFGDDEWPQMVCIETANVAADSIELSPGEAHSTTAIISVSEGHTRR